MGGLLVWRIGTVASLEDASLCSTSAQLLYYLSHICTYLHFQMVTWTENKDPIDKKLPDPPTTTIFILCG